MRAVVELHDVHRRYQSPGGDVPAVDGVSLAIRPGEFVGILGPSGSGKSTLLDLLVRWQLPDRGIVRHVADLPPGWHGIALIPQDIGLLTELTASENVQLAGGSRLLPVEVAEAALAAVGLAGLGWRLVHEMSMGEQQRVAVARATAVRPVLLVADEPTAHQDERNADRIVEVLRACVDAGTAVVMATHDVRVAGAMDRLVRMRDGRISDL